MPISRTARTIAAACLVVVTLLGAAPRPAAALEPPRPLPGYRPAFVTETGSRPWTDCLWASGAMLLDKWTSGRIHVSRQDLRALSDAHSGGSSLADLRVAFGKLGLDLGYSPGGGMRLSWRALLKRLGAGAGAVLLGDDGKMPRRYGRWDPAFWKKTGEADNHAVYIERYDAGRGRVWLMDPLASGDWHGEWISVAALRKFAWSHGGSVSAAVSPPAEAAPFAGVSVAPAAMAVSASSIVASWHIRAPARWHFRGADVNATFAATDSPLVAAAQAADAGAGSVGPVDTTAGGGAAPAQPSARVNGRVLGASAPLPTTPGAYLAAMTLTDRRFGQVIAATRPAPVFVPGTRRAFLQVNVRGQSLVAGASTAVSVYAANSGTDSWTDGGPAGSVPSDAFVRDTRVVAAWVRLGPASAGDAAPGAPDVAPGVASDRASATLAPVELQRVPLVPGRAVRIRGTVVAPAAPGRWALVVDVVDDIVGSYAALGSAPAVAIFDVVAARGIEPVQ
jgi:hypothetical protein